MIRHVALLRAVNVGGRGKIAMSDLKAVASTLGFCDTATILQSGSLVFTADGRGDDLESRLEMALSADLGLATEVMIRSAAQWHDLIATNPFAAAAKADPSHLLLLVCKAQPNPTAEVALRKAIVGRERIAILQRAAYATYPDGIGRSKLTIALIERHLGTPATGRNWNTVQKIATLLST